MQRRARTANADGMNFELRVLKVIQRQLKMGRLGLLQESCKLFHHKAYYSRDRQASIITDISIEIHIDAAGPATPSIIWIWECKHYSHSVRVDDIEEFHAKLQQIGADRTKGTVIASGPFQRSALKYARSHGIGVARLLTGDRVTHFVRSEGGTYVSETADAQQMALVLSHSDYRSHNRDFFGVTSGGVVERSGSIGNYLILELGSSRSLVSCKMSLEADCVSHTR